MRLALFSDVHGNVSGLRPVLEAISRLGAFDAIVCVGDIGAPTPPRCRSR